MRHAPSVEFPVGRSLFHGGLLLALGVMTAVAGVLYLSGACEPHARPSGVAAWLVGGCVWMLWAGMALRNWLLSPVGVLRWDAHGSVDTEGQGAWSWRDASAHSTTPSCHVQCLLDLQQRVLIRLVSAGAPTRWIWAERKSHAPAWNDLRRALVYSGN